MPERLPKGAGYRLTVRPFAESLSDDMATAAAQLNSALEALIRERPEQYLWGYDRYKAPSESVKTEKADVLEKSP